MRSEQGSMGDERKKGEEKKTRKTPGKPPLTASQTRFLQGCRIGLKRPNAEHIKDQRGLPTYKVRRIKNIERSS